jgi:hypothetical protein
VRVAYRGRHTPGFRSNLIGFRLARTVPINCPVDSIVVDGQCSACDDGSYPSDDGAVCWLCEPGTFLPPGTAECLPCEEGSYSSDGATQCTPCEPQI